SRLHHSFCRGLGNQLLDSSLQPLVLSQRACFNSFCRVLCDELSPFQPVPYVLAHAHHKLDLLVLPAPCVNFSGGHYRIELAQNHVSRIARNVFHPLRLVAKIAASGIRTINTAEVSYFSTYQAGYAATLARLGPGGPTSACPGATVANACLIDGVLSSNGNPPGTGKSG